MFKIVTRGWLRRKHRLVASEKLTAADFQAIASQLGVTPVTARKTGFVTARQVSAREAIETHWNGIESKVVAMPGDWVVTNLARDGRVLRDASGHANTYAIEADKFPTLYEHDTRAGESAHTEFGAVYKARGQVQAIRLSGGFDIMAPWSERQVGPDGYLLLNGAEVYGNNRETFEATYEVAT